MATYEKQRHFKIVHSVQHPFKHSLSDFSFTNPALPGVTDVDSALQYIVNVLYPQIKGQVATPADLPAAGNTLFDFYTVLDDGDGKSSAYRWIQYDGEATPSWKKVYDFDWGPGTILSNLMQQAQDSFVVKYGSQSRDAAGNIVAGLYGGQWVYGGTQAGEHLTLFANNGDGAGAHTGYVQVDDNFRPTQNEIFTSGTATERWLKSFQLSAEVGTLTLVDDAGNNEFDFTTTRPTVNFGSSTLLTTGDMTATDFNMAGYSSWIGGANDSAIAQFNFLNEIFSNTGDPNGVVNPAAITPTYDLVTRTVTLTGTFDIYTLGKKRTITGPVSVVHADTIGEHFIYFDSTGTLISSTTPWNLTTTVQIAVVVYNNTAATTFWAGPEGFLLEERHGIAMDGKSHEEFHRTIGTYVKGSGFAINGTYSVASGTGTLAQNTYGVDAGTIVDEDIEVSLLALPEGDGVTPTYPIFYRTGLGGEWRWYLSPTPYLLQGANFAYNLNTAGTWSLPEITQNGRYMNMYVAAIPFLSSSSGNSYRYIWIMGQTLHTSLAAAQGESYLSLDLTGLPFQEIASLWQITMRREASYDNAGGNARIEATTRIIGTRSSLSVASVSPSSHNALANRSDANSHPASAIGIDTSVFVDTNLDFLTATETSVQLALEKLSELRTAMSVGNLNFSGNTITSTDANGNIGLSPNGTGFVTLSSNFQPTTDNARDLGTGVLRFANLFLSGAIQDGTNSFTAANLMTLRRNSTRADTSPAVAGDVLIWDGAEWRPQVADAEVKHDLISGLHSGSAIPSTNPDAGHPQFALLAGRAGGQSLIGGLADSENLTLESTAHSTKGFIAAKDNFVPFTTASFSGSWLGTDLGDATHIWRDLYMTGQARGLRFENVGATQAFDATTPGRPWWNTATSKLEINTGTSVIEIGANTGSTVPLSTTNFNNILSVADDTVQKALDTLDNYVPTAATVTTDTTNFNQNLTVADNTVQKALETLDNLVASGSESFISNGKFEFNGTGWNVYANAVPAVAPESGTGGTPSVAFTRTTTVGEILSGTASGKFTKDAVNEQGEGVSYDFSIDEARTGKNLQISFDAELLSGTYADGDMRVYIYDVTNATVIEPVNVQIALPIAGIPTKHIATFQSAVNSTSYRLIFHCATVSALAYTVLFDNVTVWDNVAGMSLFARSPSKAGFIQAHAGTSVPTGWLYCDGSAVSRTLYVDLYAAIGTTWGSGDGSTTFNLPNLQAAFLRGDGSQSYGGVGYTGTGVGSKQNDMFQDHTHTSSSYIIRNGAIWNPTSGSGLVQAGDTYGAVGGVNSGRYGSETRPFNAGVKYIIKVYDDTQAQVGSGYSNEVVAVKYYGNAGQALTADVTDIPYATKEVDTHGAWDGSKFTAPIAGLYEMDGVFYTTANIGGSALQSFKNGSGSIYVSMGQTGTSRVGAYSGTLYLNKGDTWSIRSPYNLTLNAGDTINWISIKRISAQTIVPIKGETVACSYGGHASTSLGTVVLLFTTKDFDTHNAYDPSNGRFTAPISGYYRASGQFQVSGLASGTNQEGDIWLYKNGGTVIGRKTITVVSGLSDVTPQITRTVYLKQGEYIHFEAFSNIGGSRTVATQDYLTFMSVEKV